MHATFSVWFSTAKGAVVSQATVSPLTWWSLARKMPGKVADRIFRSSSNFSLFGGKCSCKRQTITVRSQIAKACAHCRSPDCGCLFRSYAVYLRYSKLFLPLCSLADTDTAPFNFSRDYSCRSRAHAADALASFVVKQMFAVSLAKTNVCDRFKRAFPECSARFVSACYLIRQPLLITC